MNDTPQDVEFLRTLSVLYVEDDPDTRGQLQQFLKRRCGEVFWADNGRGGLESFRANRPALVVTDILMPGMDGLEMAMGIREIDGHVPIIVTTAFEQTDYLLRSIEAGVDKYVTKPVNTERLLAALLTCGRRIRAERQLELSRQLEAEEARLRHLETMGILAGGMAHDFNNLLQVIVGYISLARINAEPGSRIQEYLEIAENSSSQARELGQRLLVLSKGNDFFNNQADLGRLITETVEAVCSGTCLKDPTAPLLQGGLPVSPPRSQTGSISRSYRSLEELPPMMIDTWRMRQLFAYLTVNAIEAMPSGGNLKVEAEVLDVGAGNVHQLHPGPYVRIAFSDDGCGIPAVNLQRIFEPYFSTKETGSQKGCGLSLALCHAIVRKHGGTIHAESCPGSGSSFIIYLPLAEGKPA